MTAEFNQGQKKAEADVAKIITDSKFDAPQLRDTAAKAEPNPVSELTAQVSVNLTVSYRVAEPVAPDLLMLRANPNAFAVMAWANLELALRALGQSAPQFVPTLRKHSSGAIIESLRSAGLVSEEECRVLLELRQLRNLAAHPIGTVSEADALRFKRGADGLVASYHETAEIFAKRAVPLSPKSERAAE